jgi:hypothetical protein
MYPLFYVIEMGGARETPHIDPLGSMTEVSTIQLAMVHIARQQ